MISVSAHTNVLWSLAGVFIILAIATLVVAGLRWRHPRRDYTELKSRVNSWWVMVFVFTLALILSRNISIIFFAFVSFLALKEYFSIIPVRQADRRVLFWAYLAIPVQYYLVGIEAYGMFTIWIPVYLFLFLPLRMVSIGDTRNFLSAASSLQWGLMMMVFSLSHLAYLLVLPGNNPGVVGGAGLVLYLVFLTQFNDVAQYVWGKLLGKTMIVPTVSPNKTLAGLVGGVITTTVLAVIISRWLTPFSFPLAVLSGLIIAGVGFIGDIVISSIKRDLGVKDTGSLIPGHGGILDRIDSLVYTAPIFFHLTRYFYYV